MPQYLYRVRPTRPAMLSEGPTEHEAAVVARHFEHLQALQAEGTLLMAGRTTNDDESAFGIVVFVAESEGAATALMESDPALVHGVMQAELFPYRVALWSPAGPGSS